MKIVIAPDSFKGCLTSEQVCEHIETGFRRAEEKFVQDTTDFKSSIYSNPYNKIEIYKIPIADGGEGTVSAFVKATNGKIVTAKAHDPLMRDIETYFGVLGDGKTAVIEMCAASGLTLLSENERNPMLTTTYGTGELIKAALDQNYRHFIIGVGGSATNDGGIGMAQALGVRFYDNNMAELGFGGGCLDKLSNIDLTGLDPRIKECNILVACDVENPLCGQNGASYVFAKQKGATEGEIDILDRNLQHYSQILKATTGISISDRPGAGAAGGLAAALLVFLNAKLEKGIEVIATATNLEQLISSADLVITGEGKIDNQTSFGKAPSGIAQLAKEYDIPVIAICGALGDENDLDVLYDNGFTSIFAITNKPMTFEESIKNSPLLIEKQAEAIARLILGLYVPNSR